MAATPPLARALRAALVFRQPSLDPARLGVGLFVETVVRCDEADRTYRATIGDVLASGDASEVLATASAFRTRVREIRSATRTAIDGLLVRSGQGPIDFDPLDIVSPRLGGLSHVDVVRLADLCDRARLTVGGLRAEANARIAPFLSEASRSELAAAKRARIAAFHGAVHAELAPLGFSLDRFSQTVESLATLADGWY